jgi:hypothetical protein
MHPEFLFLDFEGNIYYTQWVEGPVRKVINYNPGLMNSNSLCGFTEVPIVKNEDIIEIYPNPVYDYLKITAGNNITSVTITDIMGQTVYTQYLKSEMAEVNISRLANGVYFVAVTDEEGKRMVQKIVKQ